jgi:uncharacterized protein YcbX
VRVTGLYRYPLKSARGASLDEATLDPFGIAGDRRWCLRGEDGKVITQRDCPALARLEVREIEAGIELHSDGRDPVTVLRPEPGTEPLSVLVWRDRTEGLPAGAKADAWLGSLLERPCRLLYMTPDTHRQVSLEYGQPGDRVSFADGYPLLLTSEASLADLNRRLDRALPMDRFRPNLVIDGEAPFAEDEWARIRVGSTEFRVVKPCARCVVTTTDQRTGAGGPEPLRTLASFRNAGGKVLFGENLIHDGPGPVRLGDPVEVLERRSDAR